MEIAARNIGKREKGAMWEVPPGGDEGFPTPEGREQKSGGEIESAELGTNLTLRALPIRQAVVGACLRTRLRGRREFSAHASDRAASARRRKPGFAKIRSLYKGCMSGMAE